MSLQTASQLVLLLGVLLTALGGYGSYHFGRKEQELREHISDEQQTQLKDQIARLQASTNEKLDLIYEAVRPKEDTWLEVEMKNAPAPITDYLKLLFAADRGRISGMARMKGSDEIYSFSTTANNRIPVAIRNVWIPSEGQYKSPMILQFLITEKTDPNASLQIFTSGFIFSRGQEPH